MMFYQSPFAHQASSQAVPPAFNEVTLALRQLAGANFQYLVETKKLCLAVCAAEEVASELRGRGQPFDSKKIFHQELQNQILAFALMRVLPDDVVKTCVQTASLASQTPASISAAGRLTRELEAAAGESKETVERVQEALVAQPLFRVASQMPHVFANLEQAYERCAPYAAQLLGGLKSTMGMLVNATGGAGTGEPQAAEGPADTGAESNPATQDVESSREADPRES